MRSWSRKRLSKPPEKHFKKKGRLRIIAKSVLFVPGDALNIQVL